MDDLMRKVLLTAGFIGRMAMIDRRWEQVIERALLSHWLYPDDRMTPEEFAEIMHAGCKVCVILDGDEAHGLWTYRLLSGNQRAVVVLSSALVNTGGGYE